MAEEAQAERNRISQEVAKRRRAGEAADELMAEGRAIGERIADIVAARGPALGAPALIVQPRARRALAALLRMRAPSCLVLSIAELPPTQPIEVLAVIGGDEPQNSGAAPALPRPDDAFSEELAA